MTDSFDLLSMRHLPFLHNAIDTYPNDVKDGDIVTLGDLGGVFIIRSVPLGGSLDPCQVCIFANQAKPRCANYHYICADALSNYHTAVRVDHD